MFMDETNSFPAYIHNLQKIINNFLTLTKIDNFFYLVNGSVVCRQRSVVNKDSIYHYLAKLHYQYVTIFPTVLDSDLLGFFVLNTDSRKIEHINMYRSYLESVGKQLVKPHHFQVLNNITDAPFDSLKAIQKLCEGQKSAVDRRPLRTKQRSETVTDSGTDDDNINRNLTKALNYINDNINSSPTLEEVASQIYLSTSYLSRLFKKNFKVNFIDYINYRKVALAQREIALTGIPINKLAKRLGFSQPSYFTKIFKQKSHLTPSKYRQHMVNTQKVFTIPRDLSWLSDHSVYELSRQYFRDHQIEFDASSLNGYPYVFNIDGLANAGDNGWVYQVDCRRPNVPPNNVTVGDKSVIQWYYTEVKF